MIGLGHTSAGVIIGATVGWHTTNALPLPVRLAVVFVLGIASHYLLDAIPHGHYMFDAEHPTKRQWLTFFIDTIGIATAFCLYIWLRYGFGDMLIVVSAVAGAQLPDILAALRMQHIVPTSRFVTAEERLHGAGAHWHSEPDSPIPGKGRPLRITDIWQVALFALAIFTITI